MKSAIEVLKLAACLLVLLGIAVVPLACGEGAGEGAGNGSAGNGSAGNGNATGEPVEFTLDALPEIEQENRLLPRDLLDESAEWEEGETYALQGRVKEVRRGLFTLELVDDSKVDYNPAMPEPWIYCCTPVNEVQENLINVRFVRDGEEMPVRKGDYVEPSFRLVDLITVTGRITKSGDGTPIFLATGYVIDERPELGDHVEWPES